MEEKNFITIMELLAEKLKELQVSLSLMKYENDRLKKENEELKWHLNPLGKRDNQEVREND